MALEAVRSGYGANVYPEASKAGEEEKGADHYAEFLRSKIEELSEKFRRGETKPSYRIGAQSFTEREWDELLAKFDALQETIRSEMREEHAKRELVQTKQAEQAEQLLNKKLEEQSAARQTEESGAAGAETAEEKAEGTGAAGAEEAKQKAGQSGAAGTETAEEKAEGTGAAGAGSSEQESLLLAGEFTACCYPSGNEKAEDIRYITCYTAEGIFCRKAGQTAGFEWSIRFEEAGQYQKVMQFIGQFSSDWNMRFASKENFWRDFLDDSIDLDGFMEFLEGTDKGVPDYTVTVGDSVYIDREKMQWAKYMNQEIGTFYTAQEMEQIQQKLVAANASKLHKLTEPYENIYRINHPEYRGEAIFREYPGGPLYTANEIGRLMYKRYLEENGLA